MASTPEAVRLSTQHRLAQIAVASSTANQMGRLWALLDARRLDATTARWIQACLVLLESERAVSAQLATAYLTAFRFLEIGSEPFTLAPVTPLPVEAITTSLHVTGPLAVKAAVGRGVPLNQAMASGRAQAAGAAERHAVNAGRDLISDTVDIDDRALGWARHTSSRACVFCAYIAARGPIFKTQGTARFQAHDSCHCVPEPVYRANTAWPPGSRRYQSLYQQASREGGDTLSTFRQLVEAPASAG